MVYFLSCASQSADMNKRCPLCIFSAYSVSRLFSEGGAYWQNKFGLEIVVILIFEGSGDIQVHEFANKNSCQLELSPGLEQEWLLLLGSTRRYMISPLHFLVLWHVLLLQNSKVAGLLPLGLWLRIVSKKLKLGFARRKRTTFPEPVVSSDAPRRQNKSWSVYQFLFSSLFSSQKALCVVNSMFSTAFVICCRLRGEDMEGKNCSDLKPIVNSSVIQE